MSQVFLTKSERQALDDALKLIIRLRLNDIDDIYDVDSIIISGLRSIIAKDDADTLRAKHRIERYKQNRKDRRASWTPEKIERKRAVAKAYYIANREKVKGYQRAYMDRKKAKTAASKPPKRAKSGPANFASVLSEIEAGTWKG